MFYHFIQHDNVLSFITFLFFRLFRLIIHSLKCTHDVCAILMFTIRRKTYIKMYNHVYKLPMFKSGTLNNTQLRIIRGGHLNLERKCVMCSWSFCNSILYNMKKYIYWNVKWRLQIISGSRFLSSVTLGKEKWEEDVKLERNDVIKVKKILSSFFDFQFISLILVWSFSKYFCLVDYLPNWNDCMITINHLMFFI